MEQLRDEIVETERTRNDLLKWKLVLTGGLGAAGLGFAGTKRLNHADLVLAAIPPVALYVDLLCRNFAIKMLVIGTFFRTEKGSSSTTTSLAKYESFVETVRGLTWGRSPRKRNAFALEDWALAFSTSALSGALVRYALSTWSRFSIVFALSGTVGLLGTGVVTLQYRRRFRAMRELGDLVPPHALKSANAGDGLM